MSSHHLVLKETEPVVIMGSFAVTFARPLVLRRNSNKCRKLILTTLQIEASQLVRVGPYYTIQRAKAAKVNCLRTGIIGSNAVPLHKPLAASSSKSS